MQNLKWILQPLSAFALGMLLVLNLTIYLFWYLPGIGNLSSSIDQMGASLVRNLAFEATSSLYANDRAAISNILNRYTEEKLVLSTTINSESEEQLLLTSRPNESLDGLGKEFQFPIHFSDELLGYATITLSERNLHTWQSQAITSWVLFNLLSFAGLGAFIYFRTLRQEKRWHQIVSVIEVQLPDLFQQLSGSPEDQLLQLMDLLNDPMMQHGQILKHLRQGSRPENTERLIEQIELVASEGIYPDIALVSIQCQNWQDLIRTYPANELQETWADYESLMIRVGELYSGALLPDGFTLAFGLNDDETYAYQAVCAARVLQIALNIEADMKPDLSPVFGISVSSGPAFVSRTHKHGIPLPLITGDADIRLAQLKALQPINQVILAEPILQHDDVNQVVEASLLRDITLRDGQRLEVWELERLKSNDDLLTTQAKTLVNTNRI